MSAKGSVKYLLVGTQGDSVFMVHYTTLLNVVEIATVYLKF